MLPARGKGKNRHREGSGRQRREAGSLYPVRKRRRGTQRGCEDHRRTKKCHHQPERRSRNAIAPMRELSYPVDSVKQQCGEPVERRSKQQCGWPKYQTKNERNKSERHEDSGQRHGKKIRERARKCDSMKIARQQGKHSHLQNESKNNHFGKPKKKS